MRFLLSLILPVISFAVCAQTSAFQFSDPKFERFENIRDFAVFSGGTEYYFTYQKPDFSYSVIYRIVLKDWKYQRPVKADFCGKYRYLEPAFSPDGLRLYFVSDQPHGDSNETDFDIWYIERKTLNDPWSDAIHPDAAFNSEADEFYPSVCSNGDLYFTSDREGTKGKDDIFYAPFKNGNYTDVISLPDSINTAEMEYNACVAPDGSFLIFGAYERLYGFGSGDLYISFSLGEGKWSRAVNLGAIANSERMDYCPAVDLKNHVLYLTSKRQGEFVSDKKYAKELEEFPGGRSRLFFVFFRSIPPLNQVK